MKTKKLQLLSLVAAFGICASGAIISSTVGVKASAADKTYSATTLFTTTGGAKADTTLSEDDGANSYLKYTFTEGVQNVEYRQNLAYKWHWNNAVNNTDGLYQDGENYFSLVFSFSEMNFDYFTVSFYSQQNSKTAEDETRNDLVFTKNTVAVRDDSEREVENKDLTGTTVDLTGEIVVRFSQDDTVDSGEYIVSVNGEQVGVFTNIAGSYAKYSASSLPSTLTFSADTPVDDSAELKTTLVLKELNRQSMEIQKESASSSKIVIKENAAPVLAVNDDIKEFTLGTKLYDFTAAPVSVCNKSVTSSAIPYYYQFKGYDEATGMAYDEDIFTEAKWTKLTSTVKILDTDVYSLDLDGDGKADQTEYVAIRYELTNNGTKYTYYLTDYAVNADDVQKFDVVNGKAEDGAEGDLEKQTYSFLKVSHDSEAPALTADYESYVADYQASVDALAETLKSGSGYYFYLPSLYDMIQDEKTPYTGLTFMVYYQSEDAATSMQTCQYNNLQFPINKAGAYRFKVIASDKFGNKMKGLTAEGEELELTTTNVWEDEKFPVFTFTVKNNGIEIEEESNTTDAYVGKEFEFDEFTIKGESGYGKEYSLYTIEGLTITDDNYEALKALVEKYHQTNDAEALRNDVVALGGTLRKITTFSSAGPQDEDATGWSTHDNRFRWNADDLTFTPYAAGYYLLELKAVDSTITSDVKFAYQIVEVSNTVQEIDGENIGIWIQNNVVTVVFLVIAVLSLIGIIVVVVVNPKDNKEGEVVERSAKAGKFSDRKKK